MVFKINNSREVQKCRVAILQKEYDLVDYHLDDDDVDGKVMMMMMTMMMMMIMMMVMSDPSL